jgi:hypothetical protein
MKTIKAKVHRLPTEEITDVLINTYINPDKHSQSPILDIPSASKVCHESNWSIETIESRGFKFQHLYFTTDEEIKEGDKILDLKSNEILTCAGLNKDGRILVTEYKNVSASEDVVRKIIATTDPKLNSNQIEPYDTP